MRITLGLLILIAVLQGCSTDLDNPCSLPEDIWTELNRIDSLVTDSLIKERQRSWMRYNYDEPSLFQSDHEAYRFQMHCSGSENYSKIVRVTKLDSGYSNVVIKEFNGTTGALDTKGSMCVFELPAKDWKYLKNILESNDFWTTIASCDKKLLHGCGWSIEAYSPEINTCTMKNYHRIGGCYPVDSSFLALHDFFERMNSE